MKDYAKVINQSKEIHGREQVRQTLAHSAVQKSRAIPATTAAPKKSGSGFFAVVAIFIVVAILFAVYRQYMHHRQAKAVVPSVAAEGAVQQQVTSPQFDFYSVLPNGGNAGTPSSSTTVQAAPATPAALPAAGAAATATATTAAGAPVQTISTTAPSQYYLNAGEFANEADAQQMLSQLLLLGTQANIKSIQDNGAPSYQVLVGPFDDTDAMNIVKNQLMAHQIQASVVQQ